MRKKGNIVTYTAEEVRAMLDRGEDDSDWARVDAKTEEELAADVASDPDWADVPEDWVSHAHWASGYMIGRKENKKQVTMRFDADILDHFKSEGRGWQSRMNAVLRVFVDRQQRSRSERAPAQD